MGELEPRIAILASGDKASGGGGSTAEKFARDVLEQEIALNIVVAVCNNPPRTVGVYDKFDKINADFGLGGDKRIDVVNIGPNTHPGGRLPRGQTLEESFAMCTLLEERSVDFVVMLGFMRVLTGDFINTWGWKPEYANDSKFGYRQGLYHPNARISNNHPSILPFTADSHGEGAHKKALKLYHAGTLKHTAMTWHLASAEVDKGPVVYEVPVEIKPEDDASSLGRKVQKVEKELTVDVILKYLTLRSEHLRGIA